MSFSAPNALSCNRTVCPPSSPASLSSLSSFSSSISDDDDGYDEDEETFSSVTDSVASSLPACPSIANTLKLASFYGILPAGSEAYFTFPFPCPSSSSSSNTSLSSSCSLSSSSSLSSPLIKNGPSASSWSSRLNLFCSSRARQAFVDGSKGKARKLPTDADIEVEEELYAAYVGRAEREAFGLGARSKAW